MDSLRPPVDRPPPADAAWSEVCRSLDPYRANRWSHPVIGQTVQRLGGVRRLCESESTATDRAHFFKIDEAITGRETDETLNARAVALTGGGDYLPVGSGKRDSKEEAAGRRQA